MTTPFSSGERPTSTKLNTETLPGKVLARGRRITNSTASSGTTVNSSLRLDDVPIKNHRLYEIGWKGRADSSVNTDIWGMHVTYTTDGSTPTVASTLMIGSEFRKSDDTEGANDASRTTFYVPIGDQTLSLLLCHRRVSGTGAVTVFADNGGYVTELWIRDCGDDPGDTGVDI